jgi:hypothetical protein
LLPGGRGAWLALLMVVAGCSPHVQQPPVGVPAGTPETQATAPVNPVRDYVVATWNVAWATTRNNKFPRDSATWQRTRDFAIALGADIVALQEVDGKPIAEFLLPPSAGFGDWRTTNTDAPSEEQRVVIVTRAGIPVQGHTDLSSIGVGGLRAGLDSTVMLDAKPLRIHSPTAEALRSPGNRPANVCIPVHPLRQFQSDPLSPPARTARCLAGFLGFLGRTY